MNRALTWLASGGPVMFVLTALGAVLGFLLVERYLAVGEALREAGSAKNGLGAPARISGLRRMGLIHACIVIAPLLGLLGTVSGVIEAFDSMPAGGHFTEMGRGIRHALLTTQYGLAIAVPGLLAERALLRRIQKLDRLDTADRLNETGGA